MKEPFSGNRVVAGCMIYLFLVLGVINIMGVSFSVWPEYYGVEAASVMSTMSISTGLGIVGAFFLGAVYRKITPRRAMIIGALLVFAMGAVLQVPKLPFLCLFMVLEALTATFCIHTAASAICVRWFVKDVSSKIGLCVMSGVIGGAVFVLLSGFFVPLLGIAKWWLVACLVSGVGALFCAVVLVRDTPEALGQLPYGYDPQAAAVQEAAAVQGGSTTKQLFQNPAFWVIGLAILLGGFVVVLFSSYTTAFLTSCGVPLTVASGIYSVILFAGGVLSFVSGKIIDKIGVKAFVVMIFLSGIVGCLAFAHCGSVTPGVGMYVVLCLCCAMNYPMMMIANFISAPLFGRALSDDAMGKLTTFMSMSSCLLNVVFARLLGAMGYVPVYRIWAVVTAVAFVIFLAGLAMGEKRRKKETAC